jgi:hypothetical protein
MRWSDIRAAPADAVDQTVAMKAALSRLVPRSRWPRLFLTPETVLR